MNANLLPSFYNKRKSSGPNLKKVRKSEVSGKRPMNQAEFWLSGAPMTEEAQKTHARRHTSALGLLGCLNIGVTEVREYMGTLYLPQVVNVYVLCHWCTVDLTKAVFLFPETKIRVIGLAARVRVMVSPGVRVRARGISGCGGFAALAEEETAENLPEESSSPLVRLTGLALVSSAYAALDREAKPIVVVTTEDAEGGEGDPQTSMGRGVSLA